MVEALFKVHKVSRRTRSSHRKLLRKACSKKFCRCGGGAEPQRRKRIATQYADYVERTIPTGQAS